MRKYLHKKVYEMPLYRGVLVIIITNSPSGVRKMFPDFDDDEVYAHSLLAGYRGKQAFVIIINPDNSYRDIKHGTIAHEAVHIANYVGMTRGFVADFDNDEPICYLVEWVTDKVYKLLKKKDLLNKIV